MDKKTVAGVQYHGIVIKKIDPKQSYGTCLGCGKDKFYINPGTGCWDCKVCGTAGDFGKFLEERMKFYTLPDIATDDVLEELSKDRGIKVDTLKTWGVGYNQEKKEYTVPAYIFVAKTQRRGMSDIHNYVIGKTAMSTPGSSIGFMMPANPKNTKTLHLTEGEWDGLALYEMLGGKEDVIAVPGAGNFPKNGVAFFRGKDVKVYYDNDEAGNRGTVKVFNALQHVAQSVEFLHWPQDKELKEGFDVRDLYLSRGAHKGLYFLRENMERIPCVAPGEPNTFEAPAVFDGEGEGIPHHKVLEHFRKWLNIKNPEILEVVFGTVFANLIGVDPLWMFIVGPPGSCKTELIRTLEGSKRVESVSTLTPATLISGWNQGGADPSLIPKLHGKILTIKDFTPILTMNQNSRDDIFSILRDCYDGKIEKPFGNGIFRKYLSRFGVLTGVTPAIEAFSTTNNMLGERFLKYTIRHATSINVGKEDIACAIKNMRKETSMREHLRKIATETVDRVIKKEEIPEITEEISECLQNLAQYVAVLRGVVHREKYTNMVLAKPTHEIGTRLAKQLCALALGVSVYRNENYISEDTMKVVQRVACDTVPDRVEEIVRQMHVHTFSDPDKDKHHSITSLSRWCNLPPGTVRNLLNDFALLGIAKQKHKDNPSDRIEALWCLGGALTRLILQSGLYVREVEHEGKILRAKQEYGRRHGVRSLVQQEKENGNGGGSVGVA